LAALHFALHLLQELIDPGVTELLLCGLSARLSSLRRARCEGAKVDPVALRDRGHRLVLLLRRTGAKDGSGAQEFLHRAFWCPAFGFDQHPIRLDDRADLLAE